MTRPQRGSLLTALAVIGKLFCSKMKITRKMLLIIIASMGIFLIAYSVFRHFTGIGLGEKAEKYMMDIIVFGALGLFVYNRKMAGDERKAKEAAEEAKRRAAEEPEPEAPQEQVSEDEENLPHWERNKQR